MNYGIGILWKIPIEFLLGSTFRSSWFLIANLFGILCVIALNKISKYFTACVAIGLYLVCMLRTCYGNLLPADSQFNLIIDLYPTTFYQSFPISIIWTFIGNIIASKKIAIKHNHILIGFIIASVLLVIEHTFCSFFQLIRVEAYCIMMIPVVIFFTLYILDRDFQISKERSIFIRHCSTVIYCLSTTFGWCLDKLVIMIGINGFLRYFSVYVITIIVCLVVTYAIDRLTKVKNFKWMRFMY